MGPALVAAFGSVSVALIMVVLGPLAQRWVHKNGAPDDDLDVVRALSALVAEQDERIHDLEQQLTEERIRCAECLARESARRGAP